MSADNKYTLDELLAMNKLERSQKISEVNITKSEFCKKLLTDKKFKHLPGKGSIITKIGAMSEDEFQAFILLTLNRLG